MLIVFNVKFCNVINFDKILSCKIVESYVRLIVFSIISFRYDLVTIELFTEPEENVFPSWAISQFSTVLIYFPVAFASSSCFRFSLLLKFRNEIALQNCIFINNYFNQTLPTPFKNWFTLSTDSHTDNTRWSLLGCLKIPPHKVEIYGRQSVNISAI